MNQEALENLVRIHKLHHEAADSNEVQSLIRSGNVRLQDAGLEALSLESRFDLSYNAAHALSLAALRHSGYRSDNRYLVFQCLQHTLDLSPAKVPRCQRPQRHPILCPHHQQQYEESSKDAPPKIHNSLLGFCGLGQAGGPRLLVFGEPETLGIPFTVELTAAKNQTELQGSGFATFGDYKVVDGELDRHNQSFDTLRLMARQYAAENHPDFTVDKPFGTTIYSNGSGNPATAFVGLEGGAADDQGTTLKFQFRMGPNGWEIANELAANQIHPAHPSIAVAPE